MIWCVEDDNSIRELVLYTLNNALSFPMFRQWAEELGVSLTEEETAEIEQVAADWEGYFGSE